MLCFVTCSDSVTCALLVSKWRLINTTYWLYFTVQVYLLYTDYQKRLPDSFSCSIIISSLLSSSANCDAALSVTSLASFSFLLNTLRTWNLEVFQNWWNSFFLLHFPGCLSDLLHFLDLEHCLVFLKQKLKSCPNTFPKNHSFNQSINQPINQSIHLSFI